MKTWVSLTGNVSKSYWCSLPLYKGLGARLERAIYNFMLDEYGKEAILKSSSHHMVNHDPMFGTGQYPKFKEDTFELKDTNYVLIPTAVVP